MGPGGVLHASNGIVLTIRMGFSGRTMCCIEFDKSLTRREVKDCIAAIDGSLQWSSIRLLYGLEEVYDDAFLGQLVEEGDAGGHNSHG